jgi:hypothetical protein
MQQKTARTTNLKKTVARTQDLGYSLFASLAEVGSYYTGSAAVDAANDSNN